MDAIAKDIRSAHAKDFDTAPETSVADTIREGIEEAANFKGSTKETQLFLLCHQLGLDYKSLSPEEFTALMKALNRSKKLKSGTNQRGRKGNADKTKKKRDTPHRNGMEYHACFLLFDYNPTS